MQKKRINYAVSELLGAVILLAIVTSVMALVFFQLSSDKGPYKQAYVKLVGEIQGTNLIVEHQGGDPLSLDTSISISYGGKNYKFRIGDIVVDDNHNGFWNLGERLIFPFTYDLKNLSKYDAINLTAVDKESNSIQFLGSIKFHPVVDLGLKVTVSNPNPIRYDYIYTNLTLTCHGGDINGSANVKIKYLIPYGLQYKNYTSEVGTYDNATGIWSIDQFTCGQSVTLSIRSQVISAGVREFTQFALILDGSGSISASDWTLMQTGLSTVLANSSLFPNDGSVELTTIQFGNPYPNKCKVEISPTIITTSNYLSKANYFKTMAQGRGGTPMAAGIYLTIDTIRNSINFNATKKQIILMVTDGKPTYWSDTDQYIGQGDGSTTNSTMLRSTEDAKNYSVTHLELTQDKDAFDVFAIGTAPDIPWLNNSIVWPQPGYIAPPFNKTGQGWVSQVSTWQQFSERISQIFKILFKSIPIKAEIISSFTMDPNSKNNIDIEIIQPSI
jgi:uncharacterized protein YegL